MSAAPDLAADRFGAPPATASRTTPEWIPGFSDGLGDRYLNFDLSTATAVERLRFKPEFGDSPIFEAALRERTDQLQSALHPSLAVVRGVVRYKGEGLVLESKHTAGRRLSQLPLGRGAVRAIDVIRQLTPVLVQMHRAGDAIGHGAVGAERIVVTREGRLVLVEAVLGSALAALQLPVARLQSEFGLAIAPGKESAAFSQRSDLVQLGFLSLSLLLGRRVNAADYPVHIDRLVSECSQVASEKSAEAAWLRRWIERALQIGPNPFRSAQEALDTLSELSDTGDLQPATTTERPARPTIVPPVAVHEHTQASAPTPPLGVPASVALAAAAATMPATPVPSQAAAATPAAGMKMPTIAALDHHDAKRKAIASIVQAADAAAASRPEPVDPPQPKPVAAAPASEKHGPHVTPAAIPPAAVSAAMHRSPEPPKVVVKKSGGFLVPVLAGLAVAEAACIAVLMARGPEVVVKEVPAPPVEVHQTTTPAPQSTTPTPPPKPAEPPVAAPTRQESSSANSAEHFGGIKVTSPIPLQVFENGKLVGSSVGPIALLEGSHPVDLVNDAYEFKTKATPFVKPGQMTGLTIPMPNGRISINAVPWADVSIDGKPAGQTPLANLSVPIGEHEIVFHHPQFTDQKQTAIVKVETPARVSFTFQK